MATQYLNTEKLENKKKILEAHKVNIMDYLTQIKDEYMNLIKKDSWWGPRSDKFFESLKSYWYDFSAPEDAQSSNRGIIGNIETDFNNMINFIQNAIDLSLGKDVDAAKEIESINDETPNPDSKTGVAGAIGKISESESAPVVILPVTIEMPEKHQPESHDDNSAPSGELEYVGNSNIISTEVPVSVGKTYDLSQEDINYLAYVAMKEQASPEGAKIELSLILNRYEQNNRGYDNVRDYVKNCGWWSSSSTSNYKYPGDEYVAIAEDVLLDGNRYLPNNVVEHDYIGDITSVKVNGVSIDPSDRSAYVPYETVIKNCYGATYTFVGFAPTSEWGVKGDPFGYIS